MWFNRKESTSTIPVDEIMEKKVDLSSLFSAINNRDEINQLYRKLCRLVHPDRYIGEPEKLDIAQKLFQEVQSNRTNLEALRAISERAKLEL